VLQVADFIFQYLRTKDVDALGQVKEIRKQVEAWKSRKIPVEVFLGQSDAGPFFRGTTLVFPWGISPETLASELAKTSSDSKYNIKVEGDFMFSPDLIKVIQSHNLSVKSFEINASTLHCVDSPLGFLSMEKLHVIEDCDIFGCTSELKYVLGQCQPEVITLPDTLLPALNTCTRIKHLTITSQVISLSKRLPFCILFCHLSSNVPYSAIGLARRRRYQIA